MAVDAIANRIEIFGTVSTETMEELAVMAVRQGVSLSAGGRKCVAVEEILRAAVVAQRKEIPLVLYCMQGKDVYVQIEHLLKASNVPYQVVAPFSSEDGEFMARLFDGMSEFPRPKPMEKGLRFKVTQSRDVHASASVPCLQAA